MAEDDNEYSRIGAANIFAFVEPRTVRHFNRATPGRKTSQLAAVLLRIDKESSQAKPLGDGQAEHLLLQIASRSVRLRRRQSAMAIRSRAFHTET